MTYGVKCKYKSSSEPKLQKNVTSNESSEFLGCHPETLVLPRPKVHAASVCKTENREVQKQGRFLQFSQGRLNSPASGETTLGRGR